MQYPCCTLSDLNLKTATAEVTETFKLLWDVCDILNQLYFYTPVSQMPQAEFELLTMSLRNTQSSFWNKQKQHVHHWKYGQRDYHWEVTNLHNECMKMYGCVLDIMISL